MFDNQQQPQPGGYVPPRPPQPAQSQPRPAMPGQPMGPLPRTSEPEDIFSGVSSLNQRPSSAPVMSEPTSGIGKKILLIILIIVIVLLSLGHLCKYIPPI